VFNTCLFKPGMFLSAVIAAKVERVFIITPEKLLHAIKAKHRHSLT